MDTDGYFEALLQIFQIGRKRGVCGGAIGFSLEFVTDLRRRPEHPATVSSRARSALRSEPAQDIDTRMPRGHVASWVEGQLRMCAKNSLAQPLPGNEDTSEPSQLQISTSTLSVIIPITDRVAEQDIAVSPAN